MRCNTKRCRKEAKAGYKCYSCQKREYAQRHPVRYCWQTLKNNAKRRGKIFELTFEQFSKWATKTKYLSGKGRSKESYSIDRIDNDKGYTVDNIQLLTLSQNTKKQLQYDYATKTGRVSKVMEDNRPTPF